MKPDGAASRTAEYMALFRAIESRRPQAERLFCDPDAARFLKPALRLTAAAAAYRLPRAALQSYIDRRWPGPRASAVVRTRAIDEIIEDAVARGATQVVLLGAGYDTRATRLAQLERLRVYELDHPATQARKRRRLGRAPDNVRYVPVDLERTSVIEALDATPFDARELTCVLWEGVFSYLTPAAIDATLAALVELCAPGSVVCLTYVDQAALDAQQNAPESWISAVGDLGEPFKTGLHPAAAGEFFALRGLDLAGDESTAQVAQRIGAEPGATIPGFYRVATLLVRGGTRAGCLRASGVPPRTRNLLCVHRAGRRRG
jgi:methyltransferase (TIGR00027 family)